MKKMTFLACAAMLTSLALTGCQNENNDPQYSGEVVKTEFSIAMPNQLGGPKRMPSTSVQKGGMSDFAGMTNIVLIPFKEQDSIVLDGGSPYARLGDNNIQLADLNASEVNTKNSKAKVYKDVSIPLNTSAFLFYAKSKADNSDVEKKFSAGSLTAKTSGVATTWATDAPDNITFELDPIKADYENTLLPAGNGGKLLKYLTSIAIASDGEGTPKRWYEYTAVDDAAMKAMFDTYTDLRYLSSFGVSRLLTDLHKSIKPLVGVSKIAKAINDSIKNSNYIDVDEFTSNDTVVLISALRDYPHEINLPDGAINIAWDGANHVFKNGAYANMTNPANFVYPAQLWYYVNSQIKTSNTSKKTLYDNTDYTWGYILDEHRDAISVNTLTRAVAIEKPIQYAVARFDVTVKLANASMADNSEHAEGIATAVDVSAGFPVKAVFVGGQQKVRFDFTRTGMAGDDTEYTIYDRTLAETWTATTAAPVLDGEHPQINHTLVLENGTSDVRIAIELENTGKDFYGYDDQLIPHGGKFYVCAQLTKASATETGGHVFKQDYTTTANLTLQNLQKAYSTLPDLRTPQLELGFSVDLTWQSGHTYNINFE